MNDVPAQAPPTGSDAEDLRAKYLYAMAETENTRKRLERRFDDASKALKKRLLLKFLPMLDNLERALAHPDSPELRAGLEATARAFQAALESEGVTPLETAGRPFDPQTAEAVGTRPADEVADETVVEEAERGYRVDGELLRPARVVVAKNG